MNHARLALVLLIGLPLASFLPPPAKMPDENIVRMGIENPFQSMIAGTCGVLDHLFPCERAVAPVGTALAYGACAAIFWELAAIPCFAAGGLSFGIGAGVAVATNPDTCLGDPASWRAYDECWTANWGATKDLVTHARTGEVTLTDVGGATLDVVGSALPVTFGKGAQAATKAVKLADFGADASKGAKAATDATLWERTVQTAKTTKQAAKNVLTGGTSEAGEQLAQRGRQLKAGALNKAGGWDASFQGVRVRDALPWNKGRQTAFKLDAPPRVKLNPKYQAGRSLERLGTSYQRPGVRVVTKTVPDVWEGTHGARTNAATNAAKSGSTDQPEGKAPPGPAPDPDAGPPAPDPDGDPSLTTNGPPGHKVTIRIHAPPAGRIEAYPSGTPFTLSFTLEAEAGLSWWGLWLGKVKLDGDAYPTPMPLKSETRVLNTPDHAYPPGHYALTLVASDGLARASTVIYFDIQNPDGSVPPIDRWLDASCQVDVNANGYPDCIDSFTNTFAAPTTHGEPNLLHVGLGLFVLLGFGVFIFFRLWRG